MCNMRGESFTHVISELVQKEYNSWHNDGTRMFHWELSGVYRLNGAEK